MGGGGGSEARVDVRERQAQEVLVQNQVRAGGRMCGELAGRTVQANEKRRAPIGCRGSGRMEINDDGAWARSRPDAHMAQTGIGNERCGYWCTLVRREGLRGQRGR